MSLLNPDICTNRANSDAPATILRPSSTDDIPLENDRFILRRKSEFFYDTTQPPTLPSPHHVIVRIIATGICGSDVHYWQHGAIGPFKVTSPLILGHESAGTIHTCGSTVTHLQPGDRIALEPGVPCDTCRLCRLGRYNLCPSMQFAATPPHNGTLATFYTLPASFCFKLPPHISFAEGTLVEPLSVAVHCAKLGPVAPGSSVLVLGAGPIGLLCCAVARAFGASTVLAADILAARLAFAKRYAATHTSLMGARSAVEEQAASIIAVAGLIKRGGFDIAIDASGVESAIQVGIHALARGGTFVQAGLGKPQIVFPVAELGAKELVYKGSFRYGAGDYELAVETLKTGQVSVKELITHEFAFGQAEKAFENVKGQMGIKSVIYGPRVPTSELIGERNRVRTGEASL